MKYIYMRLMAIVYLTSWLNVCEGLNFDFRWEWNSAFIRREASQYSDNTGPVLLAHVKSLTLLSTRDGKAEFANSVDLDEVAPPHPDLHCVPSRL